MFMHVINEWTINQGIMCKIIFIFIDVLILVMYVFEKL